MNQTRTFDLRPDPNRRCGYCGKPLARKFYKNGAGHTGAYERTKAFQRRKFCDRMCMGGWMALMALESMEPVAEFG